MVASYNVFMQINVSLHLYSKYDKSVYKGYSYEGELYYTRLSIATSVNGNDILELFLHVYLMQVQWSITSVTAL